MKKPLLLIMTVCFGISCSISSLNAQTTITVHSVIQDGNWSTALENIKKICFYDSGVSFLQQDHTSQNHAFGDVRKISFDDTETMITEPGNDRAMLNVCIVDDRLIVEGWDENRFATLQIISVNGILMQINKDWSGQPVMIGSLNQGSYILSIDRLTFKFNKL